MKLFACLCLMFKSYEGCNIPQIIPNATIIGFVQVQLRLVVRKMKREFPDEWQRVVVKFKPLCWLLKLLCWLLKTIVLMINKPSSSPFADHGKLLCWSLKTIVLIIIFNQQQLSALDCKLLCIELKHYEASISVRNRGIEWECPAESCKGVRWQSNCALTGEILGPTCSSPLEDFVKITTFVM